MDIDLFIECGRVVPNGIDRDAQTPGDFGVGRSATEKVEDVPLAVRQSRQSVGLLARRLAQGGEPLNDAAAEP